MTAGHTRRRRAIGAGLALVAVTVVLINQRDVGVARDEIIYMQTGANYARWWLELIGFQHGASEASVTRTFGGPGPTDNNREHPAVMKTLFGLSERLLHRTLGITDEVTGYRAPSAVLHGVLVWLAYAFALEVWGLAQAIVAALLLVLLPRALFHAGLACFDAPSMALWFATVYAYWRCLDGRRWPWQVGVAWGVALGTKHTALLLPFALGVHYLVVGLRARRAGGTWSTVVLHRWRVIASVSLLGPATLYVAWPWLWHAPCAHVRDWLAFHLTHVHYNYEYLGRNWNAPRFPWHVALVTTLFTVPVATLAATLAGASAWIAARSRPGRSLDPCAPALLLALSAAASIGPFALGTTPIFGAEKHWMPALPTICIAAGVGVVSAAGALAAYLAGGGAIAEPRATRVALALVAGGVVLAAAVETCVAEPYALTWYNALAGGAPGGADLGMNRQFWGVAARGVLPRLALEPPAAPATYIYTHDASPAWGSYQRLGLVRPSLRDAGWEQAGIERSRLALVIHELHFNRHDYLIWNSYGTVQPIYVLRSDGVPIVSLYRRPH